jgi:ectoine hydroxylase-related dioxygenase (phytanoyl-CoA dioxygenase family)
MKTIENKNFNFKKIKNQLFDNKNLLNLSFRKSDLNNVSFKKSFLYKVDFWNSNLDNVNLSEAKLKNCVLTDTNLNKAKIFKTNFLNSNLSHSNLKGLNLKSCTFKNTNLRDALYDQNTIWPKNFDPELAGAIKISKKKINNNTYKKDLLINKISKEIKHGKGFYVIKNYFTLKEINRAKKIIDKSYSVKNNLTFASDKRNYQKWVFNLIGKDMIFRKMIQPKIIMKLFKNLLGKKFVCGFFSANCLLPGARGQTPHIDYPYLHMVKPGEKIPIDRNGKFLLNCQTMILLDDFTKFNGATEIVPGSQNYYKYPTQKLFDKEKKSQLIYPKGSLIIFNGLSWHTATSNFSYDNRTAILGQYLPYFITPMVDLKKNLNKKQLKNIDAGLRQLLGIDLKNPEIRQ